MKTVKATVGARGIDSLELSNLIIPTRPGDASGLDMAKVAKLKPAGVDFFVGYLGAVSPGLLQLVLAGGLAFMPVTFAAEYDGPKAVKQCKVLGLPSGCTVWLDLEGLASYNTPAAALIAKINAWATAMIDAGYEPGLYVGSPQPLTGPELYALKVVRYWKAPSRIQDRNKLFWDGPDCGFCMYQLWPSTTLGGVWSDVNFIQQDFRGRLPSWVVA